MRSLSHARSIEGPEIRRIIATTPSGIIPFKFKNPLAMPPIIPPIPAAPTLNAAIIPGSIFCLAGSGGGAAGGGAVACASSFAAAAVSFWTAAASAVAARLAICSWIMRAAFL